MSLFVCLMIQLLMPDFCQLTNKNNSSIID